MGQWEGCPDGCRSDGESVGGGGPFRLRQMGGSCLTMPEPNCWSSPAPCWDEVEETEGRLELRMLVILEDRRYGTLLLVIGIPPACNILSNGSLLSFLFSDLNTFFVHSYFGA